MKIKRYSISFLVIIGFILCSSIFLFWASVYSEIKKEEYEQLGLPILNINTSGKRINSKENYKSATFTLNFNGSHYSGDCKIKGRGNSTWYTVDTSKLPYLLKLDKAQALLGLPAAKKWVLKASAMDKTFLRDNYAFYLANTIWNRMRWNPRQRFIILLLNGKYTGLYNLEEKVEVTPERLNLNIKNGDFLIKVDYHKIKDWYFTSILNCDMNIIDADEMQYTKKDFDYIQNIVVNKERYLAESIAAKEDYSIHFDMASLVDWFLVNEFTKNHDSRFQGSCYFYYDAGEDKIYMGPVWDFDLACGNTNRAKCNLPENYITATGNWYERLINDEYFYTALKERWLATRTEAKQSIEQLQKWADELKTAAELNDRVWKSFGHRQWPNTKGWKNRKTYQSEVDYMIQYMNERYAWLDEQWGK